jgi:transcriptional regulator with XRE-family HTH domain
MYPMGDTLGSYLKEALDRRGWSGRTLAMYAELGTNTVAKTLRGETTPDPDTILKIASALGVDELHLLHLAGHIETPALDLDPTAAYIAKQLTLMDPSARQVIQEAVGDILDLVSKLLQINKPASFSKSHRIYSAVISSSGLVQHMAIDGKPCEYLIFMNEGEHRMREFYFFTPLEGDSRDIPRAAIAGTILEDYLGERPAIWLQNHLDQVFLEHFGDKREWKIEGAEVGRWLIEMRRLYPKRAFTSSETNTPFSVEGEIPHPAELEETITDKHRQITAEEKLERVLQQVKRRDPRLYATLVDGDPLAE